jgi:hypothetical protein
MTKFTWTMTALLLFVLMGGPQLTPAWAAPQQNGQQSTPAQNEQTDQQKAPDPNAQQAQPLPDSPSATQTQQAPAGKKKETPLGAATAQQGQTAGGAASKPAGSAIAPAKQRQVRSLLIKLGVIGAAGAAIGTVFALSRGTNPKPPGAR